MHQLEPEREYADRSAGFWLERFAPQPAGRRKNRLLRLVLEGNRGCFECLRGLHNVCDPNICTCCGDFKMKRAA